MASSDHHVNAISEVTFGTNAFAFELYRALSKENPSSNVFTSPLSLQIALALAYSGAIGKTAEEIATVLKIPKEIGKMFDGYNALINILKDPVLSIATKMFIESSFGIKTEFNMNAVKYFESDAEKVNFMTDSSSARDIINTWVEKKTKNKIKDLIPDGILNTSTKLVLVNAIHFKANWKEPFPAKNTHPDKFYINDKDTVEVQMMFISENFRYAENSALDSKILELPYEGGHFSMYIILPNKITGLAELESKISKMNITDLFEDAHSTKVEVTLPKFEISQTMDLENILKKLGCETMFDEKNADFSGISDVPLVISKVIQKAFIQVDEKGTEAAAATGLVANFCCSAYDTQIFTFKADHPFLFLVKKDIISSVSKGKKKADRDNIFIFIGKFIGKHE